MTVRLTVLSAVAGWESRTHAFTAAAGASSTVLEWEGVAGSLKAK